MSGGEQAFRILVIQQWTTELEPIERALRAAGVDAAITRVDFEAALHAALAHDRFDAAILDPATPGLSREVVEACFELNRRDMPVLLLDDVETLGTRLATLFAAHRN